MSDSSQEEKQNFLRESILEKGYDTSKFVEFLTSKKGEEGADVSNWSMNDLKVVVKEFIKLNGGVVEEELQVQKSKSKEIKPKKMSMFDFMGSNTSKTEIKKVQTQTLTNNQAPNLSNVSSKPNVETKQVKIEETQSNIYRSPSAEISNRNEKDAEYGILVPDTKKCKLNDSTEFAQKDKLEITVSSPEKKNDGGFFSKDYITYLVSTTPVNYKVRRRYNDFSWFKEALLNLFSSNVIPALPRKKVVTNNDTSIQKRMRALEKFMNYLALDPLIKNSQIFYDFLFIGNESNFNSKKKVYENNKAIENVQDFKSNDGNINLNITEEKESYLDNIKDNSMINVNILKKINVSFKSLSNEINAVISRMEELSGLWNQLYKVGEKYYDSLKTCETYKQMSNLFQTWSKILKEQNQVVNVDMREHYKFLRKNFTALKDTIVKIEYNKNNFLKAEKNLIYKKDDLFKKGDPSKWELNLSEKHDFAKLKEDRKLALLKISAKETSNVVNLKEFYGYFLNRGIYEYERIREINGSLNKENIINNSKKLSDIYGKMHVCVGEINGALDEVSLSKNDYKCNLKRIPLDDALLK